LTSSHQKQFTGIECTLKSAAVDVTSVVLCLAVMSVLGWRLTSVLGVLLNTLMRCA